MLEVKDTKLFLFEEIYASLEVRDLHLQRLELVHLLMHTEYSKSTHPLVKVPLYLINIRDWLEAIALHLLNLVTDCLGI